MPDYPTMTATEAIRHAKDVSGMTADEIAAAAGIRPAAVRRYLAMDSDDYFPGLDKIPALCRAMHNDVLLQWLQAQIASRKLTKQAASRAEVLTAAARAAASLGDVQRTLADTADSGITPFRARELRSQLRDVVLDCQHLQDMLLELASASDITEAEPLFSLRQEPATPPWWKKIFQR